MSDENQEAEAALTVIKIPESAYLPLRQIIALNDDLFSRLINVLSEMKAQTNQDRFEDQVLSAFAESEYDELRPVVSEIFRLDFVRSQTEMSVENTAALVANSVYRAKDPAFKINKTETAFLRKRITELLRVHGAVTLTAKASELLMEHSRIYYHAKIYSDIRPIFNTSGDSIEAAVIMHNLVIHHSDGEAHKDFHIALDDLDLTALRDALDRAETKAAALRNMIEASGITFIDTADKL